MMQKSMWMALTVLALSWVALASPARAGTVIENDDWLYGEAAEKALAYAKERNLPIVLLVTSREPNCPRCINAAQDIINARPHRDMVRIVYYLNEEGLNSESVVSFARAAGRKCGGLSPFSAYYVTAQGEPLGFVSTDQTAEASSEGSTVLQIHQWINSVPGDVARADREAAQGRYTQALDRLETIERRDAQVSHLIQQLLGKAKAEDPMPEQPVSAMFPDIYQTKLAEYDVLAQAELDAAKALVAEDKLRDAQRALRPLARGPEALSTTEPAKALLEEVEDKLRG